LTAVIAGINQQRVVSFARLFQSFDNPSDAGIHMGQAGGKFLSIRIVNATVANSGAVGATAAPVLCFGVI
jgi:hypothetical protein